MKRGLAFLGLILLAAAAARPDEAAGRLLLIRAGRAVLGDGREIAPAALRIRGDRIDAVGETLDAPAGAEVVDLPDAVLAPGFVDAHAWLDRERDLAERLRVDTPEFRARDVGLPGDDALAMERADGVTACLLSPNDRNVVGGRPALVTTDGKVLGEPEALKASLTTPALSTDRFPSSHWGALEILAASEPARGARLLVAADTVPDVLAALSLLGRRSRDGDAIVGGAEAYQRAAEIAATKATVVWGPARTGGSPRRLRGPSVLEAAGVPLAFGTGGRPGTLRRTAVLAHRAGLSRAATIRALGVNAASVVGAGEEIGRLAKGRRADVVVLSGDPLDLSARVLHLLVAGEAVPCAAPGEGAR